MVNVKPTILRLGALCAMTVLILTGCGGGSSSTPPGNNPAPGITPTPFPSTAPSAQSVDCPTSGSLPSSVAIGGTAAESAKRTAPEGMPAANVPGLIAITYRAAAGMAPQSLPHGVIVKDLRYPNSDLRTRVIAVTPGSEQNVMARLRAQTGVTSVSRIAYRSRMTVTPDDPYYQGFPGTLAPYYESASVPGEWDMHVIGLGAAWSSRTVGAPIAIVDTGVDVTHPDLGGGKIIRTECFVTYPSNTPQTTGPYVTDTDGHGTDVAGIADADTNNAFGFAGTAYDAPMLAYRIFPSDPSGGCQGSTSTQCESNTVDEASAINDAVAHGAKVINLSLGGSPPCDTTDPEYTAVENAISSGVVVVAAAGNGNSQGVGQSTLDCPAADPGVIAVGASALNDSGATIQEYVASYSNYVSPSNGRYLVAPGGDPSGSSDSDDLHWIENIYSSTAAGGADCSTDYAGESGDCRVLIAGTSMATPHVVGVVSLMLGVNPSLTPAQIAQGLCASSDNIGDPHQGCGRLDAANALSWAASH